MRFFSFRRAAEALLQASEAEFRKASPYPEKENGILLPFRRSIQLALESDVVELVIDVPVLRVFPLVFDVVTDSLVFPYRGDVISELFVHHVDVDDAFLLEQA
ncbi:MAG: hypothetical protein HGA33_04985, partial [Candidatus Moranbacteria bacterium]|nr:hypothetical protein [Candidatus Moranbacteria bacterium]